MCTNKRWIRNKYDGRTYFVKCGHCPACLQEKAMRRANRIRNNRMVGYVPLFVHLTYDNDCLPYVKLSDIVNAVNQPVSDPENTTVFLPLYRNSKNRRIRVCSSYRTDKSRIIMTHVIDYVDFQRSTLDNVNFFDLKQPTHFVGDDVVSLIYYKDVQRFIKRLRSYCQYHELLAHGDTFKYYVCSEYGENFARAHFHLLIYVPTDKVDKWKCACAANWPFDSYDFTYRNIEIARNAAGYVSTYLNSNYDLSPFFKEKSVRCRCSYSHEFGFGLQEFTFYSLFECILQGNLTYNVSVSQSDGTTCQRSFLYPSYVTNRFFPKFKGMRKLTSEQLALVVNDPSQLAFYVDRLGIESSDELNKLQTFLFHKKQLYDYYFSLLSNDEIESLYKDSYSRTHFVDRCSYGYMYVKCMEAKHRTLNRLFYSQQNTIFDIIYSYDNFEKIQQNFDLSHLVYERNPNFYPLNKSLTDKYEQLFYKCNKQHKVIQHLNKFNRYGKN